MLHRGVTVAVNVRECGVPGAPKFWAFPEALFALRLGGKAAALQTSPPAGIPGVAALRYSGAYPVTRLAVEDATLPVTATLFGYSR